MTEIELARELRRRYDTAKINEAALEIHLFGIDFGKEIREQKHNVSHIVELAGIGKGYAAELSKGIRLSGKVIRKGEQ